MAITDLSSFTSKQGVTTAVWRYDEADTYVVACGAHENHQGQEQGDRCQRYPPQACETRCGFADCWFLLLSNT